MVFLALGGSGRSANMGNKESTLGIFSFNDGTRLSKLSTIEEVWEVFLLYHMKRMPIIKVPTLTTTRRVNIYFGDKEKG